MTKKPVLRKRPKQRPDRKQPRTSWDPLAHWYDGWVGVDGSSYHRKLAIPITLELLAPQTGERILDIGAGQGVLAPSVKRAGARYVGVDASAELVRLAKEHHGHDGRFLVADARALAQQGALEASSFDAAVFLLSIQDMDPLEDVLRAAVWALKPTGRVVVFMTHPCFRIPRQSGWGFDEGRKLQYRRIDSYLTPNAIPMKRYPGEVQGVSLSFHRPLEVYMAALAGCGLTLETLREIPGLPTPPGKRSRENLDIPLFLGLRARRVL